MKNIIPGTCITSPRENSTISFAEHNFGYCTSFYATKSSKFKTQFLRITACRESLNNKRDFIFEALSRGLDKYINFDWDKRPFFYFPVVPIEIVAMIFDHIENRIGVNNKATFQKTDESGVIAIFPGRFWSSVACRFGLFTCLLRACCRVIEKENYREMPWEVSMEGWLNKAIHSDEYLSKTQTAVLKFMEGNTFVLPLKWSGDWFYYMKEFRNHTMLLNPLNFNHNQYIGYVKDYAYKAWVNFEKVQGKDSEIWTTAERYAALNACR